MNIKNQLMVALVTPESRDVTQCEGLNRRGLRCVSNLPVKEGDEIRLEVRDGQRRKVHVLDGLISRIDRLFDGAREVRVEFIDPEPELLERLLVAAERWGVCETSLPPPRRPVRLTPLEHISRLEIPPGQRRDVARALLKNELFLPTPLDVPLNSEIFLCFDEICIPARVVLINEEGTALLHEGINEALRRALRRLLRPPSA